MHRGARVFSKGTDIEFYKCMEVPQEIMEMQEDGVHFIVEIHLGLQLVKPKIFLD